jgi:hypothetical protein
MRIAENGSAPLPKNVIWTTVPQRIHIVLTPLLA